MSARALITTLLVAAGVLAPAAIADAKASKTTKSSKYPTISKIAPMRVAVGETMTITGKGFRKGRKKNTVVFRRSGKRSIFVKADGLSTRRLKLKVPAKVGEALGRKSGKPVASRFRLRVLARRFGRSYTTLKKSPTILPKEKSDVTPLTNPKTLAPTPLVAAPTPARAAPPAPPAPAPDCDGDGNPDATDPDDDNDLLIDTTEVAIGTNRCLPDSDGDGMLDGWEYQSAIDLNWRSCPKPPAAAPSYDYPKPCAAAAPEAFPTKHRYPNPLVSDRQTDYDGDGLPAWAEYAAWERKAGQDASYRVLNGPNGMWYSAGKQASVDTASDVPVDNGCTGQALPDNGLPFGAQYNTHPEFDRAEGTGTWPTLDDGGAPKQVLSEYKIYTLARADGDACLQDDERDEDGDFLSNYEELIGPMSGPSWWEGVYDEKQYSEGYLGTDFLDPDTDGDGVVDGLDDDDYDDFLNVEEIRRGAKSWTSKTKVPPALTTAGLWVNPFNPCLPNPNSRTCKKHLPVGDPAPYAPFSDPDSPNAERWPLYANPLYGWVGGVTPLMYPVTYPDPAWVDDPADPDDAPAALPVPAEVWTPAGLGAFPTTATPPLHPLPRPDLGW